MRDEGVCRQAHVCAMVGRIAASMCVHLYSSGIKQKRCFKHQQPRRPGVNRWQCTALPLARTQCTPRGVSEVHVSALCPTMQRQVVCAAMVWLIAADLSCVRANELTTLVPLAEGPRAATFGAAHGPSDLESK
jgi:hypothetical protein